MANYKVGDIFIKDGKIYQLIKEAEYSFNKRECPFIGENNYFKELPYLPKGTKVIISRFFTNDRFIETTITAINTITSEYLDSEGYVFHLSDIKEVINTELINEQNMEEKM